MSTAHPLPGADARPRLSLRLLQEFRLSIVRARGRRVIAQMDPRLRRDIGLPAAPEHWPGIVESHR